jgi:hypothetical protein
MSKSASDISFCKCKATAREISFPPGGCVTMPFPVPFPFPFHFPFPFPFSVAFPFPSPSFVPFPFLVPFLPRCDTSSPSQLSLSLPSPGWPLPLLGAPGSAQFSSSSSSSIVSSQFSGLTATKSPGSHCRQLGSSIFALRSLPLYQEKRSPVPLTFPELVVCRLERST